MRSPLDYLEELQQKPESVRRTFATVSVFVIMVIIIFVWYANLSLFDSGNTAAVAAGSAEEQPSPFTLLWNYAKDTISQVKDKFSETTAEVSKLSESLASSTEAAASSTETISTTTQPQQ